MFYYKVYSLPFYQIWQSDFSTTSAYAGWIQRNDSRINKASFVPIQESADSNFVIIRLFDGSKDYYRIVSRDKDIFYSITMSSKEVPTDMQLEYLKFFLKVNKEYSQDF